MRALLRLAPSGVLAALFVLVGSEAPAQKPETKRPALPAGFVAQTGVKYVADGDAAQELDLYFPEKRAAGPQRVLVWIHGGGGRGGSKAQPPYLNELTRGYI